MSNQTLSESFSELGEVIKSYVDARIRLWKVLLLEKITRTGTYLFTSVVVLVSILFILLLLELAFSFWYGDRYGSIYAGLLISAGFDFLLVLLTYFLRKVIFSRSIIHNIKKIIDPDEDDELN